MNPEGLGQAALLRAQHPLRHAHGLQELGAGGARTGEDVELWRGPMGGHLAASRGRVQTRSHRAQEHVLGADAQAVGQSPVAIIKEEPVVARPQAHHRRGLHGLVPRAVDLKEDLVLALPGDLPVIDPPGCIDVTEQSQALATG